MLAGRILNFWTSYILFSCFSRDAFHRSSMARSLSIRFNFHRRCVAISFDIITVDYLLCRWEIPLKNKAQIGHTHCRIARRNWIITIMACDIHRIAINLITKFRPAVEMKFRLSNYGQWANFMYTLKCIKSAKMRQTLNK